jgi:hypothetical protein
LSGVGQMQIVLRLTNADGTSELVTIKAGENFSVPDGVAVELVSLDGVDNLRAEGGDLVLSGEAGTVRIAGLGADMLTSTASISNITLDGPLPDGFLHLLQWDQDNANKGDNDLRTFDTSSHGQNNGAGSGNVEDDDRRLYDEQQEDVQPLSAPQINSYGDDTGAIGDGITADAVLQLTGTADANAEITIYDGLTEIGSATADENGAWSFTTPSLSDGVHEFSAVASDGGSESAPSTALTVTVDTVPPAAPIIASFTEDTGALNDNLTSDNALTLTGTAEANATVELFDGATSLGSTTADGAGNWSFDTASLADGTHEFSAVATDAAGNASTASSTLTVEIDATAPNAPTIDSFTNDSGTVGDGVTSDNTLTLTGTAESNARVTLFDGAAQIGTVTADGSGNWTFNTATLSDGAHSFTAVASDAAGNESTSSSPLIATIDTLAPSAPTITGFSDDTGTQGDGQTADNTLTFTGTAEAGATVNLFAGAVNVGQAVADGDGNWTVTTAAMANGSYSFTAVATDIAGNSSFASTNTNVTINATAPNAPVITGYSTDSGVAGDGLTNDATPTISGSAVSGETISIYDGATLLGTTFTDGAGNWNFTSPALADGLHNITATATNAEGTTGAASGVLALTIDTVAPAAPVVFSISDDTNIPFDGQTSDNTLTFTGRAEVGATVNVYLGATIVATGVVDGDGNWSATTGELADGYYSFDVRAVDAAGNASPTASGGIMVVDTSSPAAPTITGYSNDNGVIGDNLTSDATLTLTGTAAAGSQSIAIYDGATLLGTATVAGGGTWSFTTATLADGAHSLTAVASDAAGNASDASAALVVTIDTVDPAIPVITGYSDDSGTAGDGWTNDNTLTFTGTAEAGATVNIYSGGVLYASGVADGSGNWTATTAELNDAVYYFRAKAVDAAGNVGGETGNLTIIVDTVAPSAPEITGMSNDTGIVGDGLTSDATLTLSGTAEVGTKVTIFDGATEIGIAAVNGAGNWSFTTEALSEGEHNFTAQAVDQAGNPSEASPAYPVTIDTTGPAAPVITGFSDDTGTPGDSQTNDTTLTFTGTAVAGAAVNVYKGATIVATGIADGDGNWTATTSELADGYTSFVARALDDAGNRSDVSNTVIVVIDTEAPPAPAITGYSNDTGIADDGLTSDTTITLTGTATGATRVTIYDGATELGTVSVSGGSWTYTTSALTEGEHSFTAKALDGAGNASDASSALELEIDTTAPAAATIDGYSDDTGFAVDGVTFDNTQTLTGTAPEGSTVTIYDNGVAIGTVATVGTAWSFTTAALADGAHSLTVRAGDAAGNLSAASSPLNLLVDTIDPVTPTIVSMTSDTGIAGDGLTSDQTLTLTGTALQSRLVDIYDGATKIGSAFVDGAGNWSFNTAALDEGEHSFTAVSSDWAGNVSATSNAFDVTIDITRPAAPTITGYSDDTGTVGDSTTSDNTITVSGTAEAGMTVVVRWNGTVLATGVADGDGNWSATTTELADGYYSLDARTVDAAGNLSASGADLIVVVDATPPAAPVITSFSDDTGALGDGITADNTLTLTGTAEGFASVAIYDGATLLGTVTATNLGTWTYSTGILSNGEHSFTATATDRSGNVGEASAALDVTVNNVPLAAPAITSFSDDTGTQGDGQTSDDTVTFTGTAGAGLTVNVYTGVTLVATGIADGAGNWTATTASLPDGHHIFYARATNGAETSSSSSNFIVFVDTAAPATPTIDSFANDSGTIGDGLTNDATIALSGTGEANTFVTIYDGATALGSANVDGAGNWTFTTGALGEGEHSFTAAPRDAAGNVGTTSTAFAVEIDTTRPDAPVITGYSDNSGNPNDYITNDNTLTFTGTAGANETINIYLAGQIVATGVADGDGNWSATTGELTDNSYASFTARAVDTAGNSSLSSSPTIVAIDTVAPAAAVIVSYSTDSGVVGDGITNDRTLTLTGTVEAGASVAIYDGATLLGTASSGGGVWSFTTATLDAGAHSLTAVAIDLAGNEGAASDPLVITIDITAPASPTITGYSDNSGNPNDYITNDNTLTFTGTAEAGVTVNIYLAGQIVATGLADGSGNWSATTGELADTSYGSFTARASDDAGNLSPSTAPTIVAIDTVAPGMPVITGYSNDSGVVGDGITNDTTLTLTGTAAGASLVSIYDGATLLGTAAVSGGNWTFNTSTLAAGEHSFTMVANDQAGNNSDASAALALTIDTTPPAAPSITGFSNNSGNPNDHITNDNTLTFTGTAGANETVNIYLAGQIVATGVADGSGNWSATTGVLADSSYASFTARAVDVAGNSSAPSASRVVAIDTVAPDAPTISGYADDTGAAGDGITADNTLTLTGAASGGATSVEIYDGATLLGTAFVSGGTWSFATGVLADGVHSFTVKGIDSAGNGSAASVALDVTVETQSLPAPVITGFSDDTSATGTAQTSDSTLTFTGTAEAGVTVNVYVGASIVATGIADGSGNWSATTGIMPDDYYSFEAKSTDGVTTSSSSNTQIVIIDTVAPETPVITDFSDDTGAAGDGITADTTLTLTGTSEAGTYRVYIYDGATLLGFTNPVGTNWTFTTAVLSDGAHDFTAVAADVADNRSDATADFTVTINGTAPAVPVFDAVSLYSNDNTPTFTGTADANVTVNVYFNGDIIATGTADGSGNWTATATNPVADGFNYFYAQAESGGVSSNFSGAHVRSIDTAPPAAPVIVSYDTDGGIIGDGITNDTTPALSGTAEAGVQSVRVYDGETLLGSAFVSGGNWTFYTSVPLSQGLHELTAKAVDYAGNEGAGSTPLNLTIDTTAPSAPTIANAGSSTSDNTPTFTGTAEANLTVNVYLGATIIATGVADGAGNWTATASNAVSDGYQSFTARAVDDAGNSSTPSSTYTVNVDTVAPATPVVTGYGDDLGVSSSDDLTSDRYLRFTGTSELGSGSVLIYDGATLLGSASAGGGSWVFTTGLLDGGEHSFTFVSRDSAGNESAATTPLVVTIDAVIPAAPVFTSASGYTSDNTPTFTGTAEAGATVNIYLGVSIVATTTADGSGNWTATVGSPLADGYSGFTARAVDIAGNTGLQSGSHILTIDTVAPAAPIITSYSTDGGVQGDGLTNDATPTLVGTAVPGTQRVEIYDGATLLGSASANGGNWTFTSAALSEGQHTLTAKAFDFAGNASDASTPLVLDIDLTPPAAPTLNSLGTYITDNTPTFTGTAEAGATVNVYLSGQVIATGIADGGGNWEATVQNALPDNYSVFSARVQDAAGNLSAPTANYIAFVDTTPPAVPTIVSFSDDTDTPGDGITSDDTILLTGTAVAGTHHVDIYDGATLLGTAVKNGNNWTFTTSALPDGEHSFTATAYDFAGNESAHSSATVVTIDTGASMMMMGFAMAPEPEGYTAPDGTADDDDFYTTTSDIIHVDGGAGIDTLHFSPIDLSSNTLDLTNIGNDVIQSVERIDLTSGADASVTLNVNDILSMSNEIVGLPGEEKTRLTIVGDAGDSVNVADAGWSSHGQLDVGGISFNVFEHGSAQLLVHSEVPTTGLPVA